MDIKYMEYVLALAKQEISHRQQSIKRLTIFPVSVTLTSAGETFCKYAQIIEPKG